MLSDSESMFLIKANSREILFEDPQDHFGVAGLFYFVQNMPHHHGAIPLAALVAQTVNTDQFRNMVAQIVSVPAPSGDAVGLTIHNFNGHTDNIPFQHLLIHCFRFFDISGSRQFLRREDLGEGGFPGFRLDAGQCCFIARLGFS